MNYLEHIEGGPGKLPFRRKDGYNFLYKQKIESTRDGDVKTAISLLQDLQTHDKELIFDFTLDSDNVLTRLFWIDGMSRAQFKMFGDVLLFDSTYKTNAYRFPLVMFCGVDNHFKTCVFGAAILYNETVESYRWLLQKFKEAVGSAPLCVLTDQDAAMRAAIKFEYPEAKHRICSWHLERNALRNVGKRRFVADFGDLITTNYNVDDFEIAWQNLVQKHDVADHPWVLDVYNDKESWSEAHCRGYFMAMMTSTQRAESMNSYLKLDMNPELNLCDFLKHFHTCLGKMRASFLENQIAAERYRPSLKSEVLRSLENHAATLYTRKIFEKVQDEIIAEQGLILQEAMKEYDKIFTFNFVPYDNQLANACCLIINWLEGTFECQCLMLESDGIPCRHIISALKYLQQTEIPKPIIKYRWTVDIGMKLRKEFHSPFPFEDPQRRRYAQLHKECAELCLLSSQTEEATAKTINMLRALVESVQPHKMRCCSDDKIEDMNQEKRNHSGQFDNISSTPEICDPKRKRSRGAVRAKKQHCGRCGQPGHKVGTCKENLDTCGDQVNTKDGKNLALDRLYDLNTFQCYLSSNVQEYILSSGKDSIINLWEVGIGRLLKQYLRATHTEMQCQAHISEVFGAICKMHLVLNYFHLLIYRKQGEDTVRQERSATLQFVLEGKKLQVQAFGLLVSIIDFTLSRITTGEDVLFLDLSSDLDLF
ncbi:hypothetical protein CDL12_27785 [Handroanthus impetiginosus]|uniref:Uncharacterized protein n=1 Tax=Handroanthus impetiginosus TaxID=429701 RepID=A0A2G9G3J8_9LAMI|nr:hypothetical protein CDL12_27785 [Handroanthus impetiginosus]